MVQPVGPGGGGGALRFGGDARFCQHRSRPRAGARRDDGVPLSAICSKPTTWAVEHPVVAPAALTGLAYGTDRRSAGPVAIRVGVEHRLQIRLQVASGDLLGDTVGDRRNAQRARATVCLRNIDPPYRRRKIAPRRQPVPELVEVVRKINLEVCNRLCVYPSRSLVGLHTFEGFPDFPLGDVERLCLAHGLLPSPVGPWPWLNNAAPSVQLHYRAFIPTTSCS